MLDQPSLSVAGQVLLGILIATAAVFDIRFRRIPNWLVLAGIIVGLSWNVYSSSWSGLGRGAEGLGLGFILYFPLYLLRARGAGDVKLLAAVGAITGPGNCFWIFLATAILGGIIAVLVLLVRGRLRRTLFNVAWIARDLLHLQAPYKSNEELDVTTTKGLRLPHAAMMAVGTLAFILMVWRGWRA
ncbi:MAG TPA: prepilin peptidase [Bryobacteraceae bacterium]|nr:prepilin peptidase [Bryobacteraceae bacterium]